MRSDGMEHFGLCKSLHQVDCCAPEHHRQLFKALKAALHEGGIVALTEGQIEVAESLVFDVPRVTLSTLQLALSDDRATDHDGDLPGNPAQSERALMTVMCRGQKPIALFMDDGHD